MDNINTWDTPTNIDLTEWLTHQFLNQADSTLPTTNVSCQQLKEGTTTQGSTTTTTTTTTTQRDQTKLRKRRTKANAEEPNVKVKNSEKTLDTIAKIEKTLDARQHKECEQTVKFLSTSSLSVQCGDVCILIEKDNNKSKIQLKRGEFTMMIQ
jgi:hypothetical protein